MPPPLPPPLYNPRPPTDVFKSPVDSNLMGNLEFFHGKRYADIIASPMDLQTIQKKLESDHYQTPEDFEKDVLLIFDNCLLFNAGNTVYTLYAKRMKAYFYSQYAVFSSYSTSLPYGPSSDAAVAATALALAAAVAAAAAPAAAAK